MTDFGRRAGDMFQSAYDINGNNIVDNSESTADHATKHQAASSDEIDATDLVGRVNYVNRGDPAAYDFEEGVLITDGLWHDLDLSSIVPAGAVAVHLLIVAFDNLVNSLLFFRKNTNTYNHNAIALYISVANTFISVGDFVPCDTNRVIEYLATNTTWGGIGITVKGWFI